ncbi:MAG: hypothetical protein QM762_04610 [Chryseolinea sp.]
MEDNPSPPSRRFDADKILAISAIFISVITAIVSGYQTKIMREQQYSSVWPYVQWDMSISSVEGFDITVMNKGVGPAIIKSATLQIDGVEVSTLKYLERIFGTLDSTTFYYSSIDKAVLSPGEKVTLFRVSKSKQLTVLTPEVYKRTKFDICYCDIYGSCWTSHGAEVTKGGCVSE